MVGTRVSADAHSKIGWGGQEDVLGTERIQMYKCKDTPTCLHTMYAENQTKWLPMNIEYLQAELTIVNTSQTKHLIPCFQYEFDIQQYSTTPGAQC